jgi:hypothetical protein
MRWHTRRNQISSFDETDESISIGRGVSSVDYWQASCAHQPAGFVLLVQACVLLPCDAYWLPTPFSCFPFTSPSPASPCVITFQLNCTTITLLNPLRYPPTYLQPESAAVRNFVCSVDPLRIWWNVRTHCKYTLNTYNKIRKYKIYIYILQSIS